MATAIDPVCKMEVDTVTPHGGRCTHQGMDYYFCAPGCRVAFEKEPGRFLQSEEATAAQNHDHGHLRGHGHDHGGVHDHGPEIKFPKKKRSFFSRLFGK